MRKINPSELRGLMPSTRQLAALARLGCKAGKPIESMDMADTAKWLARQGVELSEEAGYRGDWRMTAAAGKLKAATPWLKSRRDALGEAVDAAIALAAKKGGRR